MEVTRNILGQISRCMMLTNSLKPQNLLFLCNLVSHFLWFPLKNSVWMRISSRVGFSICWAIQYQKVLHSCFFLSLPPFLCLGQGIISCAPLILDGEILELICSKLIYSSIIMISSTEIQIITPRNILA